MFQLREELVGDNHWLCPSCDDFQSASRTLFVSSLPQTVIIHLKRLVTHTHRHTHTHTHTHTLVHTLITKTHYQYCVCACVYCRFVYHGTSGSKIDAPVRFPLELDPQLVSHDCHVTQPLQLAACVCHFGSEHF